MSKTKVLGKCALCKTDNVELRDSHIIPKLIYKRIKSFSNSRFRNYYNLNEIYQDGEKKSLLCDECEKYFCNFEREFANQVLDKDIKDNKILNYDNFIYSLNWRILYDDLVVLKSWDKEEGFLKNIFDDFENILRDYLNKRRYNVNELKPKEITNYIIYIENLGIDKRCIELFSKGTFGYSFTAEQNTKFIIMTYFLGIICVTVYEPHNIIMSDSLINFLKVKLIKKDIKSIVREELIWQYNEMIIQKKENDKKLLNGLGEKISNRYKRNI